MSFINKHAQKVYGKMPHDIAILIIVLKMPMNLS